ncbi:MAG TPA: glycosyltransferase [Sandaracinaceae bacterium LLY-WYZ-13_1]|nr:glycosyltransferase [Sandaracinaceae bacterium LLY-WYZ-13_1]
MRILYACHQFFPDHYTGTERYTLALARQMQLLGHQVTVFTYDTREHADARPVGDTGVSARAYTTHGVSVLALRHDDHDDAGFGGVSSRIGDPRMERALDRLLRERRFDLLHCTHTMRQTPIVEVARRRGIPVVQHLTDFWLLCPRGTLLDASGELCDGPNGGRACAQRCFEPALEPALARRTGEARRLLAQPDLIVAPSRFLAGVFLAHGVDPDRVVHRTYAFDVSPLGERPPRDPDAPLRVAFLGTVLPHKGVEVLVRAVRAIPDAPLRLDVHGGSFDQTVYLARLRALALGDSRIRFRGPYELERIGPILDDVDVVVVPSLWYENNPLVVGIAHAAGVPCVVTDLGGMTELVRPEIDGLAFPRGDVDALADILGRLAGDRDLVEALAREVRPPPRIEADAFELARIYARLVRREPVLVPASQLVRSSPRSANV